ncbi:MAG TPA: hypothetical protein VFP17_05160 [Solirubrobacterales bacterium]|nr:hypothetical protein [Solirubrobacterales bacterium]
MFAHIAGLPVEETAAGFGPVVATVGGIAGMRLRQRILGLRARKQRLAAGRRVIEARR